MLVLLWSLLYWFSFGITYLYNAYFWDNSVAKSLGFSVTALWLFGLFILLSLVFFSVLLKERGAVLACVGGTAALSFLAAFVPKMGSYSPAELLNGSALLLTGAASALDYVSSVAVTLILSLLFIEASIPILNKREV